MRRRRRLSGALLAALVAATTAGACGPAPLPPPPTIAPDCASAIDPTEDDIALAERYAGSTFAARRWDRQTTSGALRVSVTWHDREEAALAFLEVVLYPCGHTPSDLDDYFNADTFENLQFKNYDNVQLLAACRQPGGELELWEFGARHQGADYLARLWARPYGPARVIDMALVFPLTSADRLQAYAEALYPELPRCG